MTAFTILEHLGAAGLHVSLGDGDTLLVTPASRLDNDLRQLIRSHKASIIAALTTATGNDNRAANYHAHHFTCNTCIAAGRGAAYGPRCKQGAALWADYQHTETTQ